MLKTKKIDSFAYLHYIYNRRARG